MKRNRYLSFSFISALLVALIFLFPLYWMVATSFKLESVTTAWPPQVFPNPITLDNYRTIIGNPVDTPVFQWFLNSAFAAISYTLGSIAVSALAAYALARLRFPGRQFYFWTCIASLVVPGVIFLIPNYITIDTLGWVDRYPALIVPGMATATGMFLLRQFFLSIPSELEDSARIDGAGRFRIFWQIVLPLSKPVVLTYGLMSFLNNWNDYLWALIVTYSSSMRTLPVGLMTLQGRYIHQYGTMMAGAVLTALPALILFLMVQRYFVKGIVLTGIKG